MLFSSFQHVVLSEWCYYWSPASLSVHSLCLGRPRYCFPTLLIENLPRLDLCWVVKQCLRPDYFSHGSRLSPVHVCRFRDVEWLFTDLLPYQLIQRRSCKGPWEASPFTSSHRRAKMKHFTTVFWNSTGYHSLGRMVAHSSPKTWRLCLLPLPAAVRSWCINQLSTRWCLVKWMM